jgi:ribonuclease HI
MNYKNDIGGIGINHNVKPAPDTMNEVFCYTDGASRGNPGPSAAAYLLVGPGGTVLEEKGWFLGTGTNNEAEYMALIGGLSAAAGHGFDLVWVFSDSELVMRQMTGRYRVSSPRLRPLYNRASGLVAEFRVVRFRAVPREDPVIQKADDLCNKTLDEVSGRGTKI